MNITSNEIATDLGMMGLNEKLIAFSWDTLPYLDGYRGSHIILLLLIFDSLSKNKWKQTAIDYIYIINKCKFSKRVYLDSRNWLMKNDFIKISKGINVYHPAYFELGYVLVKQIPRLS
jgi:hypothetical protein